jgi:hypothetical protein
VTRKWGNAESTAGVSLSPSDVNDSGFGFAISAYHPASSQVLAHVAHVANPVVYVYYLTPEAASGVRPRLQCTKGKSVIVTRPSAGEEAETREAEWQSGFYTLGSEDEKELVGVRAFGAGTIDAQGFSDFDESPSVSGAHFDFPGAGNRSALDDNGLTDSGVMFAHKLKLEPGSRIQRLVRYLRETRTPETKSR